MPKFWAINGQLYKCLVLLLVWSPTHPHSLMMIFCETHRENKRKYVATYNRVFTSWWPDGKSYRNKKKMYCFNVDNTTCKKLDKTTFDQFGQILWSIMFVSQYLTIISKDILALIYSWPSQTGKYKKPLWPLFLTAPYPNVNFILFSCKLRRTVAGQFS
jgi:hypothetical protein